MSSGTWRGISVPALPAATCSSSDDPDLFHPAKLTQRAAAKAKQVCGSCPCRLACLRYALDHGENQGVWGGTTPVERRRIRKQLDQGVSLAQAAAPPSQPSPPTAPSASAAVRHRQQVQPVPAQSAA